MKMTGLIFFTLTALTGCHKPTMDQPVNNTTTQDTPVTSSPADTGKVTYLALGDSYTIGESVPQAESYPFALYTQLKGKGYDAEAPTVIAKTGWTTQDLKRAIDAAAITKKFKIVTLLIGVNNQYQGLDAESYRKDFIDLLNTALSYAGGNKKHVFVLSIPDWSVTPFAQGRDLDKISKEIDQFNQINLEESQRLGVNYLNITSISRQATTDPSLLAADGLHPSGKMYSMWVAQLLPQVLEQLK